MILGPNGQPVSRMNGVPLFIIMLNPENGNAEIMDNREAIGRISPADMHRIYDNAKKALAQSFGIAEN